jgi:hypothetical protein
MQSGQVLAANESAQQAAPSSRRFQGNAAFPVLLAIVVYAALRSLAFATVKPIWFDEILTEVISRQGGIRAIWRAVKISTDGQPPPFYMIEHVAGSFPLNEHIAYRLPSIIAFSITLVCLYFFVKRRSGPWIALLCSSVILMTPLYNLYADEARPYSMLVACVAFALICYQRVPSVPWTIGLFVSLFSAMCLHYYAILAVSLFVAAEAFFAWQKRRLRVPVWAALLFATVPLAIFRPLLLAIRASWGAHFVGRPQAIDALRSYGEFFRVDTPWGFALAGICAAAVLSTFLRIWPQTDQRAEPDSDLMHEHLLVLALLAYPVIVFIFAKVMHGGAFPRYSLCAILGVCLGLRYVLAWFQPRVALVGGAIVVLAFGTQEFSFWRTSGPNFGAPSRDAIATLSLLDSLHRDDLPVVIGDSGHFVEIEHYASPRLRRRMVSLVDPDKAVFYLGTDTVEKNVLGLQRLTPLSVYPYADFVATHPSFLLFSQQSVFDWLPRGLTDEGDTLRVLAIQGNTSIYLVEIKSGGN